MAPSRKAIAKETDDQAIAPAEGVAPVAKRSRANKSGTGASGDGAEESSRRRKGHTRKALPQPPAEDREEEGAQADASPKRAKAQPGGAACEKPEITGLWLMKNEPEELSMEILKDKPNQTAYWDGVRNYQARNFLRSMKVGHRLLFYYSSCKVPGIAGIAKVVREAYPDHTAWDPASPYFDKKSTPEKPIWDMVDVQYERPLERFLPLPELRAHAEGSLKGMLLFSRFRLSVQPVSQEHWDAVLALAQLPAPEADEGKGGAQEGKAAGPAAKRRRVGKKTEGSGEE